MSSRVVLLLGQTLWVEFGFGLVSACSNRWLKPNVGLSQSLKFKVLETKPAQGERCARCNRAKQCGEVRISTVCVRSRKHTFQPLEFEVFYQQVLQPPTCIRLVSESKAQLAFQM